MRIPLKILLPLISIIVLLIAVTPSFYFYNKYQAAQKIIQDPTKMSEAENKALIAKVAKIIDLPEGENPEIRTVTNKAEVVNQSFFAKAENGDKVLVYSQVKKAFLYRPSLNKIINVAPITLPSITPSPTSSLDNGNLSNPISATPQITAKPTISPTFEPLKFFLLNGTNKVGLTKSYETILKKTILNATVVDRDNAKKNDYQRSIIVVINDSKANLLDQISKALNIQSAKLPDGEDKPKDTDFLIILGSDKANL